MRLTLQSRLPVTGRRRRKRRGRRISLDIMAHLIRSSFITRNLNGSCWEPLSQSVQRLRFSIPPHELYTGLLKGQLGQGDWLRYMCVNTCSAFIFRSEAVRSRDRGQRKVTIALRFKLVHWQRWCWRLEGTTMIESFLGRHQRSTISIQQWRRGCTRFFIAKVYP